MEVKLSSYSAFSLDLISMSDTSKNLGSIFVGTVAKIVDPETEKILGANQTGEIYAKCEFHMIGYLNRPEEDAKFFAPHGFIRTGDLGHFDDQGILYYDGRNKDLIKVSMWKFGKIAFLIFTLIT